MHNLVAQALVQEFSPKQWNSLNGFVSKRPANYFKQKPFIEAINGEVTAILAQPCGPDFDGEKTRPFVMWADGTCFDTEKMCNVTPERSLYITKYMPWSFKEWKLPGWQQLADDIIRGFVAGVETSNFTISDVLEYRLNNMAEDSVVLRKLFEIYGRWSEVIWVLRLFASAVAADATKTMFTYFFGPGGSGKDTVILLLTSLLGSKKYNYSRFLKKNFFVKESAPDAPSPYLAALVGARWVVCTEVPKGAINPDNVKDITDPQGAELLARSLYSDPVSFCPMFRLNIMSNEEFMTADGGVKRRQVNVHHTRLFKSMPTESHHVQSDPTFKRAIKRGAYVHETFALLAAFIPSLCTIQGDQIQPLPECHQQAVEEQTGAFEAVTISKLMETKVLEKVTWSDEAGKYIISEATKADNIRERLAMFATGSINVWLSDIGLQKKKCFMPNQYYYGYYDGPGKVWTPVKLAGEVAQVVNAN
jgi:hypothetical protein